MKIVESIPEKENLITFDYAHALVKRAINKETRDFLYIVKYEGKIISFSGEYYKFAWMNIGFLRNALSQKFGKEVAEALVENEILEIIKVYI
jgi:hypothetical protein